MKRERKKELMEIPEYQDLRQRPQCKKCPNYGHCYMDEKNSPTGAKIYCEKFAKKFYTIEIILLVILECLGVFLIRSKVSNIMLFIFFVFLYTIAMILGEICISAITEVLSEKREIKRKAKFDEKVSKIKESNEKLEREKRGETEEYLKFIEYVLAITKKIEELKKSIDEIDISDETSEDRNVKERFALILENLNSLNQKLNPRNFDSNSIEVFYRHLENFIERTKSYISLYQEKKLTYKQKIEFGKLLQTVVKKIDEYTTHILKIEEEKFISEIQELNEILIPEDDNSKEA